MDVTTEFKLHKLLRMIRRSDVGKGGLGYYRIKYFDGKWDFESRCFTKTCSENLFNLDRTDTSFIVLGRDEAERICNILNNMMNKELK